MDSKTFMEIVHRQMGVCEDVLFDKAEEYATDDDRLHNFTVAGNVLKLSPRMVLAAFMAKHTISIYDMLMSDQPYSAELWTEKITDHINYLLILQAVLAEERNYLGLDREEVAVRNLIGATENRMQQAFKGIFGQGDAITSEDIGKTYLLTTDGLKELHPAYAQNKAQTYNNFLFKKEDNPDA